MCIDWVFWRRERKNERKRERVGGGGGGTERETDREGKRGGGGGRGDRGRHPGQGSPNHYRKMVGTTSVSGGGVGKETNIQTARRERRHIRRTRDIQTEK